MVPQMEARLQQLLQGHLSNVDCVPVDLPPGSDLRMKDRGIAPGVLTQSRRLAQGVYPATEIGNQRPPGNRPAQTPLAEAASGDTVAVTCRLPGVSAGNWITASGARRWSSSIHAQAACPATLAYGP